MIQKRYLIGGLGELAIIIITLLEITHLMAKFGVYEVKTIYTMIIIVFVLTVVFVYLNVPPLLISLLCFIRSKVILTNTTPTDTTHIETTPMDIITETTQIETIPMDTTPIYTHTNTTPMNAILINTTPTDTIDNINNTYINSKNKEKNKFDIVEKYIIEIFSEYCSEEDVKNIYAVIKAYFNGVTDFSNYPSVSILESKYKDSEYKILKPLDLYHFGWNIWKHFKDKDRRKQVVIAVLLKAIFPEKLSNNSINTIVSHLKSHKEKGKIKIKEDLSKPDK